MYEESINHKYFFCEPGNSVFFVYYITVQVLAMIEVASIFCFLIFLEDCTNWEKFTRCSLPRLDLPLCLVQKPPN